jgi:hypothetical protein
VAVVRLTQVFRQAAQSHIITSAHRINRGFMAAILAAITAESEPGEGAYGYYNNSYGFSAGSHRTSPHGASLGRPGRWSIWWGCRTQKP